MHEHTWKKIKRNGHNVIYECECGAQIIKYEPKKVNKKLFGFIRK